MTLVSDLSKLVAAASMYPDEKPATKILVQMLSNAGFSVTKQKVTAERFNLLATRGSGQKSVMFYGHQDTVGLVQEDLWQTSPFELTQDGDKLYGLGAYDMKGGIIAFLHAAAESDAYVKIFLAIDEENISQGAWHALEHKPEFFTDVELIVSAEPNFGLGLHGITTARTGRVIYSAKAKGIPEHISLYQSAEDAIEKLSVFMTNLYRARASVFQDPKTVAQIRQISAEAVGMSVPALAEAEVEVLLGAADSIDSVKSTLLTLGEVEIELKPRKTPYLPGYRFEGFPYQEEIAGIITKETKCEMSLHERSSVGDDNVLASLKIPVITWGPDGGNAHKPNEWVSLKSLESLQRMYQELLTQIQSD